MRPQIVSLLLILGLTAVNAANAANAAADWSDWSDCASLCRCLWQRGRKAANCSAEGLSALPTLHHEVQALDVSNNKLAVITTAAFSKVGLVNLRSLNMRNACITAIESEAFRDLKLLVDLDLSQNRIGNIPKDAFIGNDRLRYINLNDNHMTNLLEEQFPKLPHLKKLDLQNCRILSIHPRAFANVINLEFIDLRNNSLSVLTKTTYHTLKGIKSFLLNGNPWVCDCNIHEFFEWYISNSLSSEMPACWQPYFHRGRLWSSIKSKDLICSPALEVTVKSVRVNPGDNVTLGCLVSGDQLSSIAWKFRDKLSMEQNKKVTGGWNNITLTNVSASEEGDYSCIAESPGGRVEAMISLTITYEINTAEMSNLRKKDTIIDITINPIIIYAIISGFGVTMCITFGMLTVWRTRSNSKATKKRVRFAEPEKGFETHSSRVENEEMEVDQLSSTCKPLKRRHYPKLTRHKTARSLPVVIQIEHHRRRPCGHFTTWPGQSCGRLCVLMRSSERPRSALCGISKSVSQQLDEQLEGEDRPCPDLPYDNMGLRVAMTGSYGSTQEGGPGTHSEYMPL